MRELNQGSEIKYIIVKLYLDWNCIVIINAINAFQTYFSYPSPRLKTMDINN